MKNLCDPVLALPCLAVICIDGRVLTAVRIFASVRRADQTCGVHLPPLQVFILELAAVDTRCARAVAIHDIAALDHKLVDYSVEGCFGVGQAAVFAGA